MKSSSARTGASNTILLAPHSMENS
jgi:hypothetical protein